eukprot:g10023.t1
MQKLIETGERERLKDLLRERLIQCGWRDELKEHCQEIIRGKGQSFGGEHHRDMDLPRTGRQPAVSRSPRRGGSYDGPDGGEEVPVWKKHLSFRGQPYRYAHHQNGVMGHLQVRVVAASEISEPDWSRVATNLNINAIAGGGAGGGNAFPYVTVSFGKCSERSSAQEALLDSLGTLRASWPRERLSVEVMKGEIRAGENPFLSVQVYNQDSVVQSVLSSAVSTVMGSQGSLLGAGQLDVSPLLAGGAHLIDTWVELEPKGRVHLHVEYEPKGIQPATNDVVFLESFARWGDSLVIPPGAPMVVLDRKMPFLLVAFDTFTGREGRLRLHRNCVSVVERLNWLDVALATLARPVDALLRTNTGSWCVRKTRPLLLPLIVMLAPLQASLLVAFSALKVAVKGMLMGTQAVYQESVVRMAVFLRARFPGSRGKLALALASHSPHAEASLGRLVVKGSPRLLHTAVPARTSRPPHEHHAADGAKLADAAEATAGRLQEELFRVLCQPRPSSRSLVALVRGIVAAGAAPSLAAVQALASHLTAAKDAKSLKALLSLLKGSKPELTVGEAGSQTTEDAVGIMFSSLVRAHCRRQDVTSALTEVEDMVAAGGRPSSEIFFCLLDACAIARPPLLRELEAVWARIEEEGLTTTSDVGQDLFVARMAAQANGAGYAPVDQNQEEWQQALLEKVDETWDEMLKAQACTDVAFEEGEEVTAESWVARAAALALCARDSGTGSYEAMSRSLEALQSYQRGGGKFSGSEDVFALAEVVRGLARCGRQDEVAGILADYRRAAKQVEDDANKVTTSTTKTAVDKAKARAAVTRAARVPEELLRALGARGRGLDSGMGRAYGLSLLKVVEDVAAEAFACGERSHEGVDSRLTATLQAVLTASRFLDRGDADVINKAARVALDCAAAAAAAAQETSGRTRAAEGSQVEDAVEVGRGWPGPNLAAMSLLTLLHVSHNRWEGIPAAVDVLQEMHDRGFVPPASLAAQLETVFKRHGTVRQKRRASFLLARALEGFGPPPDDDAEAAQQEAAGALTSSDDGADAPGVTGVGDAIRGMVKNSTTRGVGEWDAHQTPALVADEIETGRPGASDASAARSAEESYQLLRQKMRDESLRGAASAGIRSVEQACAAAAVTGRGEDCEGQRHPPSEAAAAVAASSPELKPAESHREILWRATVLAEKGRPHAALAALQAVDGRKRGTRVAVPYKVYALLFRALSNGYSARSREELDLAAAPTEALEWLLRGMARQGYTPNTTILNFGLESFAVAARTRRVRGGGEEVRSKVCTDAMDFMEGMRDGWNGLVPPVAPNLVSFNIIIKVMCRLHMFDQAFEALEVMERGGFEPDRYTYSTLINGLARAGDSDAAWEVMVEMTNKGIAPDSIVIDGIVEGFVRSGDVGEAISFAQHSFNQYGCAPTAQKFCRVVHAAAALDDGQHEARRAIVVAEQMWTEEWRGEGKTDHPVLGHASLRRVLQERGAFDRVNRL